MCFLGHGLRQSMLVESMQADPDVRSLQRAARGLAQHGCEPFCAIMNFFWVWPRLVNARNLICFYVKCSCVDAVIGW